MPTADDPSWVTMKKYLDGFDCVLDLENTAFRGEGVDSSIVVRSDLENGYFPENMLDI